MHTRFRVLGFTVYNICSIPWLYKNVSFLMFPVNEMNECLTTPQHENQIGYWVSEQGKCMTWLSNKDIILCRVRSHVGIRGNETAPKSALGLPCVMVGVPYTNFKYRIKQCVLSTWQDDWNDAVASKLYTVKPVLGNWRCRKDEIVTHLTHSYTLNKDSPPQCDHCQYILTIGHILLECNIFGRRDVVESFIFQPTLILSFLKE